MLADNKNSEIKSLENNQTYSSNLDHSHYKLSNLIGHSN